jgi:hypothetical protein
MARIEHTVVTLRFFGDTLDPQELSTQLGALPTKSAAMGDVRQSARGRLIAKTGEWILSVEAHTSSNDVNGLIMQLFGSLTPDLGTWQSLSQRFTADLSVGLFLGTSNEGATIEAETAHAIAARGLALGLDVYAPSTQPISVS